MLILRWTFTRCCFRSFRDISWCITYICTEQHSLHLSSIDRSWSGFSFRCGMSRMDGGSCTRNICGVAVPVVRASNFEVDEHGSWEGNPGLLSLTTVDYSTLAITTYTNDVIKKAKFTIWLSLDGKANPLLKAKFPSLFPYAFIYSFILSEAWGWIKTHRFMRAYIVAERKQGSSHLHKTYKNTRAPINSWENKTSPNLLMHRLTLTIVQCVMKIWHNCHISAQKRKKRAEGTEGRESRCVAMETWFGRTL